jgi:hypothetical protein
MAKRKAHASRGGNRPTPAALDNDQQGGSRGHSNQTGPARGASDRSRRAIAGTEQVEHESPTPGGAADAIRGPLPEGATPEDYVGGERPHKTREPETKTGTTERAGRKRNEVV